MLKEEEEGAVTCVAQHASWPVHCVPPSKRRAALAAKFGERASCAMASWAVGGVRRGYCAATDSDDPGDCVHGQQGSWATAPNSIDGLADCAARCRECDRCRIDTCYMYMSCACVAYGSCRHV